MTQQTAVLDPEDECPLSFLFQRTAFFFFKHKALLHLYTTKLLLLVHLLERGANRLGKSCHKGFRCGLTPVDLTLAQCFLTNAPTSCRANDTDHPKFQSSCYTANTELFLKFYIQNAPIGGFYTDQCLTM